MVTKQSLAADSALRCAGLSLAADGHTVFHAPTI